MIPLCLIFGDSIGVGTADALAVQGMRCEVHARVGAPSAETLRTWRGSAPVDRALIALGSNDPTNPSLARNLLELRRRVRASRVTWLAPYHAGAARIVVALARSLGDDVVQLAQHTTRDRLHPVSYRQVALSLGWTRSMAPPLARTDLRAYVRTAPAPTPIIRHAVVLSF